MVAGDDRGWQKGIVPHQLYEKVLSAESDEARPQYEEKEPEQLHLIRHSITYNLFSISNL